MTSQRKHVGGEKLHLLETWGHMVLGGKVFRRIPVKNQEGKKGGLAKKGGHRDARISCGH